MILKSFEDEEESDQDSEAVRRIKSFVRRNEARDAAKVLKIDREQQTFLDLPFYEKGRYRNFFPAEEDVDTLSALLQKVEPHQVYVSGGLADPRSVSGVCYQVFQSAMSRVSGEGG